MQDGGKKNKAQDKLVEKKENDMSWPVDAGDVEKAEKMSFAWKVHPFTRNRLHAAFSIVVLAVCAFLSYALTQSFFMSVMAVVLLFVSLIQFFVPTYYEIDSEKVTIKLLFKKREEKLSKFKKFFKDQNGVFLSAEPDSKMLDQFRGLFLIAGETDKNEIIRVLKGVFEK